MLRRFIGALPLVGSLLLVACRGEVVGPQTLERAPADVRSFILAQQLPQFRSYRELFGVPAQSLVVFAVSYGPPQDCPSGCFYLGGWGIRYGERIGWVSFDQLTTEMRPAYLDPAPGDDYLFSSDLRDRLRGVGGNVSGDYRILLARDGDTPEPVIYELARGLPADGWPFLGDLLIDAAVVRGSRRTLELLAYVSGGGWDWRGVNSRAYAILNQPM